MDTNKQKKPSSAMWSRLKKYFFAGVLVTAPAFITLYVVIGMITIVDRWVKSLVPAWVYHNTQFFGVPGVGIVLLLVLMVVIGWLTASWLGNVFVNIFDHFFANTPVLSSLYSTLKQLFHTFLGENTNAFRKVVMVEFPRDGIWSIGFITSTSNIVDPNEPGGEPMQYVFIPTTPNPTNGYLVLVPLSRIRESTMTVEQGLKTIVSMGITR